MRINDPQILAEVQQAFDSYEAALMANDVAILDTIFWDSPLTVRYGPGQNHYGAEAIAAFRKERPGGSPQRTLANTVITTFGADFATANTEFQRVGGVAPGRQSQTWVRTEAGWRVVAAHVSILAEGH